MASDEEVKDVTGVLGCVLLLDVSTPMWQLVEEERLIDITLQSCVILMQKMMIEAPDQLIGISLIGTAKDDNQGFSNVVELMPLSEPTVENVKKLKELAADPDSIQSEWGTNTDVNLPNALWQARRTFSGCKRKMAFQNLTILSCMSEPDSATQRSVLTNVVDIKNLNISLNFVNVSGEKLPEDSFYMEIGRAVSEEPDFQWDPPEPVLEKEMIMSLIWTNYNRKSAFGTYRLHLGPGVALSVKLYYLCKLRSKPKTVHLDGRTNSLVKSTNKMRAASYADDEEEADSDSEEGYAGQTDPTILKSDIIHSVDLGGRLLQFTNEEKALFAKFGGEPRIQLLWFMPASKLNISEMFFKSSAFMYPSEKDTAGSSTLFLALRDRCIARKRIPVCLLVSRWYSNPVLVALCPQQAVVKGKHQLLPDGFHVVYLPYVENFKEVLLEGPSEPTREQINCLSNVINKLKIHYKPDLFENPVLQTLYRVLEALALEEEDMSEMEDTTFPDAEQQGNRLGPLQEEFNNLFGSMGPTAVKRSQNSAKSNKKPAAGNSEDLDPNFVIQRLQSDSVTKFTVPQLKQILKMVNPPQLPAMTGLKKDQLVQLVQDHQDFILMDLQKKS